MVTLKVTTNSPSQDYTHPDDHNLRTYDMTPGFKPFTTYDFVFDLFVVFCRFCCCFTVTLAKNSSFS